MLSRRTVWLMGVVALAAWRVWAHDPAFHAVQSQAEQFLKDAKSQEQMNKALTAIYTALTKNHLSQPNQAQFLSSGRKQLRALVEEQLFSESFAHLLRVWTQSEAKPTPRDHLLRCRCCNSAVTALLQQQRLKDLPVVKPKAKSAPAQVLAAVKKADQKVFAGFAVELCDVNSDGFLESVRLDSDMDGTFDCYQLDLDDDGMVDAIVVRGAKGWSVAAQSGKR